MTTTSLSASPVDPGYPAEGLRPRSSALAGRSIDRMVAASIAGLLLIGLLINFSASARVGLEYRGDVTFFLKRQIIWMLVGLVGMTISLSLDYRVWRKLSVIMMLGTLVLLLFTTIFGATSFGGQRWLLASGSIQPSELAKLTIIIYIADWLSSKREDVRDLTLGLVPFAILTGLVCGLILAQNDLSTAVLIGMVATLMFFTAGGHIGHLIASAATASLVLVAAIALSPFRRERILNFIDPSNDPSGGGFQVLLSLQSFRNGGLFGVGFGQGQQKQMLPVPHTDAVFAVLGEELGLLGSLLVLGLFALLAWRGFKIAMGAPDRFSSLLATGISCWIAGQAFMNIAVATKSIPPTGIPLPFISFGGSSLITCMFGTGLLLNLSRRVDPNRTKLYANLDLRRGHRRSRLSRAHRSRHIGR